MTELVPPVPTSPDQLNSQYMLTPAGVERAQTEVAGTDWEQNFNDLRELAGKNPELNRFNATDFTRAMLAHAEYHNFGDEADSLADKMLSIKDRYAELGESRSGLAKSLAEIGNSVWQSRSETEEFETTLSEYLDSLSEEMTIKLEFMLSEDDDIFGTLEDMSRYVGQATEDLTQHAWQSKLDDSMFARMGRRFARLPYLAKAATYAGAGSLATAGGNEAAEAVSEVVQLSIGAAIGVVAGTATGLVIERVKGSEKRYRSGSDEEQEAYEAKALEIMSRDPETEQQIIFESTEEEHVDAENAEQNQESSAEPSKGEAKEAKQPETDKKDSLIGPLADELRLLDLSVNSTLRRNRLTKIVGETGVLSDYENRVEATKNLVTALGSDIESFIRTQYEIGTADNKVLKSARKRIMDKIGKMGMKKATEIVTR